MERNMVKESRTELFASFARLFARQSNDFRPATHAELAALSVKLDCHLSASYVQFMTQCGALYCPNILRLTLQFELEHPDLRQFFSPTMVWEKTREAWQKDLPKDLFVFATDCMGNPFCFRRCREPQDDAPVIFVPSQDAEPVELGASLLEVLAWYVDHIRQHVAPESP
jgi:hypothetical protein